ncbi:MAG: PilZ domain-containing protein, partial [Pseudobdellovibrionaceae bacterium]
PGRRLWFLTNLISREKYEGLSTRRTRDIFRSIGKDDKTSWVLWTDGWRDWVTISVVEATGIAPELFFSPPESYLVEMTKVRRENTMTLWHEQQNEFSAEQVKINVRDGKIDAPHKIEIDHKRAVNDSSLLNQPNKRTTDRLDMRLEVILFARKGSFRCRSINISLGGILLDSEIPPSFLTEAFEVVIMNPINKAESLKFEGEVVGDANDRRRLKFTEHKGHSKSNLEILLERYKSRAHYAA